MRRLIASWLSSMLLVATLVAGGCVSCEQFFMWPGAKGCCTPDGRCHTKPAPGKERTSQQCKQIAFDAQKAFGQQVALPEVTGWVEAPPVLPAEPAATWQTIESGPAPPDLLALHSTFLI